MVSNLKSAKPFMNFMNYPLHLGQKIKANLPIYVHL